MRIVVTVLSGFVLTLLVFVGGAATSALVLTGDAMPIRSAQIDATELWTAEAVKVDTSNQDFERLPQRQPEPSPGSQEDQIDRTITAAITDEPEPIIKEDATNAVDPAHTAWCRNRYRSYDPIDNAYNSYSGERRECVSPYMNPTQEPEDYASDDDASWGNAVQTAHAGTMNDMAMDDDHIQACMYRYRSYDPSDNTYQPYGGGPRRQCS